MGFWQARPDGVTLDVKVQPRSRRTGVLGQADSGAGRRLRIAVSEPPEDGRANRAACATLAATLGIPVSAVTVILGQTRREKTLHIVDVSNDLMIKLEQL